MWRFSFIQAFSFVCSLDTEKIVWAQVFFPKHYWIFDNTFSDYRLAKRQPYENVGMKKEYTIPSFLMLSGTESKTWSKIV